MEETADERVDGWVYGGRARDVDGRVEGKVDGLVREMECQVDGRRNLLSDGGVCCRFDGRAVRMVDGRLV